MRAKLVTGHEHLACNTHRYPEAAAKLTAPEGSALATSGSTIAGFFISYEVKELDSRMVAAAARATDIARASMGLPPLPVPEVQGAPKVLIAALDRELGVDTYELADWEKEGGGEWTVKIYTEWGWAGFVTGTPNQIATMLAEERDGFEAEEAAAGLACPTCGHEFGAFPGQEPCECGTVLFTPNMWSTKIGVYEDALSYLNDVPDDFDLYVYATCLALDTSWKDEYDWEVDDSFETLARAMNTLAPASKWAVVGGHLYAMIPLNARVVLDDKTGAIDAFTNLGYEMSIYTEHEYDRTLVCGKLHLEGGDNLPKECVYSYAGEGRWHIQVYKDAWMPEVDEEDFDFEDYYVIQIEVAGKSSTEWHVDLDNYGTRYSTGQSVAYKKVTWDGIDEDLLRELLMEAGEALDEIEAVARARWDVLQAQRNN